MKKKYLPLLLGILTIFLSCSEERQRVKSEVKDIYNDIRGAWTLKTRIIKNNNQTFTEDLIQGDCNYSFYILKENGRKESHLFNSEKNCLEEITESTWELDKNTKKLTTTDDGTNFKTIYEIEEINNEELKLKIISEGGDLLEDNGFEVYLILEK